MPINAKPNIMANQVIKPRGNTFFKLADTKKQTYFGERFNNSYWIECDREGNIKDHNKDGVVQTRELLCKIPEGKDDIDVATLQDDCLK